MKLWLEFLQEKEHHAEGTRWEVGPVPTPQPNSDPKRQGTKNTAGEQFQEKPAGQSVLNRAHVCRANRTNRRENNEAG